MKIQPIENVKHTVIFMCEDEDVMSFTTKSLTDMRHMVGERITIDKTTYEIIDSAVTYKTEFVETGGMYSEEVTVCHTVKTYFVRKIRYFNKI